MPHTAGRTPTPLTLVERFSEYCRELGWITGEYSDFVKREGEYYYFVWVKSSHQRRIPEILTDDRSSLLEEGRYGVRTLNYKALIFQETPPPSLVEAVARDNQLSKKIAVYDLSLLYRGEEVCRRLNETGTSVYREFEAFLRKRLGVTMVPLKSEPEEKAV